MRILLIRYENTIMYIENTRKSNFTQFTNMEKVSLPLNYFKKKIRFEYAISVDVTNVYVTVFFESFENDSE